MNFTSHQLNSLRNSMLLQARLEDGQKKEKLDTCALQPLTLNEVSESTTSRMSNASLEYKTTTRNLLEAQCVTHVSVPHITPLHRRVPELIRNRSLGCGCQVQAAMVDCLLSCCERCTTTSGGESWKEGMVRKPLWLWELSWDMSWDACRVVSNGGLGVGAQWSGTVCVVDVDGWNMASCRCLVATAIQPQPGAVSREPLP